MGTIVNLAPCLLPHPLLLRQKGWLQSRCSPSSEMSLKSESLDADLGNVQRDRDRQKLLAFVEEQQIYEKFLIFIY